MPGTKSTLKKRLFVIILISSFFLVSIHQVKGDAWWDTFGPLDKSGDPFLVRSWKFDIGKGMSIDNVKSENSKYKICRLYDPDHPSVERVFVRERKSEKDFYERFLLPSRGNIVSLLEKEGKVKIESYLDAKGRKC